MTWAEKKALIIGRAYPEPSRRHIETVCTGAITEEGELLRLYPIPLRYLDDDQKYRLWTWAKFVVQKSPDDKRRESYKVQDGSIEILSQVTDRSEQFSLIKKAMVRDREVLDEMYHADWTSLGIIEIEYLDLKARLPRTNWKRDKSFIDQAHFFVEKKPLEQPPIELSFTFRCKNNSACKTHSSRLIAWEYMEAFRSFRRRYDSGIVAFDRIKQGLSERFADPHITALALMGTHSRYPVWMVGQLYFFGDETVRGQRLF